MYARKIHCCPSACSPFPGHGFITDSHMFHKAFSYSILLRYSYSYLARQEDIPEKSVDAYALCVNVEVSVDDRGTEDECLPKDATPALFICLYVLLRQRTTICDYCRRRGAIHVCDGHQTEDP